MSNNKATFEYLLSAVDELTPEQIDMLRKRIDDRLISSITPFSEEEIVKDVEKVIQSVRAKSRKREYKPVTCSVCRKTQKVDVIIIKGTPYCGDCFEKIRVTIR